MLFIPRTAIPRSLAAGRTLLSKLRKFGSSGLRGIWTVSKNISAVEHLQMNRRVLVPVEADEAHLTLLLCLRKGFENPIGRINQFGVVVIDNLVNLPDIEMVGLEPYKRLL